VSWEPLRGVETTAKAGVWVGEGVDVYAYIKHEDNPGARRIALERASGLA